MQAMNDETATIAVQERPLRTRPVWATSAAAVGGVLALAAASAYWLSGGDDAQFLNLPLGAYLAGQGAIMAAAFGAFALATGDREG
jgi:hypothetical protein